MHRFRLQIGIVAAFLAQASSGQAQLSPAWESYAANPDAHPNIPNVSYAGYESGATPLPTTTDGRMIVHVSGYGAIPDDGVDDTE